MAQSYFIWNGADCRSKGIVMRGPAPIIRAEERVNHVQIPGSSGDLTQTEGSNIYNSYIQTITISVRGGFRVREVYKWLRGAGYVTFSGEPDKRQMARIIGAITLNRISRNMDHWAGEVQFYCQPYKEKINDEPVTVNASNTQIRNVGDVISYPRITAKASGASMTVSMGGKVLTISGLTSGSEYVIDSKTMEVTNAAGTTLLTKNSAGSFPVLNPGNNTVIGSGWSKLVIDRRERFL